MMPSVEPGLKPYQPNQSRNVPMICSGVEWPWVEIGLGLGSGSGLGLGLGLG